MIEIALNGESRMVAAGLNVAGLLEFLGIDPGRVAVELNRSIVPKASWSEARVEAGAQVEIVHFVGGG